MKAFKHLKKGDFIYEITYNGNVRKFPITDIKDNYYDHTCIICYNNDKIEPNMDMVNWYLYDDDKTMVFSDMEIALDYLNQIADEAKKVIDNCAESIKIFN